MSWYLMVLKKYVVFSGRARRKEYWYFVLFSYIIGCLLAWINNLIGIYQIDNLITIGILTSIIYGLAILLPSIGVSIRRLHDTGRSGWWIFINLIPLIGTIIWLVFMLKDSQEGTNQYGPSPKLVE